MVEKQFEFCAFDPEGDYQGLEHAVAIGDASKPPVAEEAIRLLRETGVNLVINALALNLLERQSFLAELLAPISELRKRTGRPQWLIIDEAHHALPATGKSPFCNLPDTLPTTIYITVDPETLAPEALKRVEAVLAFGSTASEIIASFARAINISRPTEIPTLTHNEILFWSRSSSELPRALEIGAPRRTYKRHTGKYALGDLGERQSFYFRGANNAINLRAQNLIQFLQIAQDVEDATWEHHLRSRDYSTWFRHVIKDDDLALEAAEVENDLTLDPHESRRRISAAVSERYTLPARAGQEPTK